MWLWKARRGLLLGVIAAVVVTLLPLVLSDYNLFLETSGLIAVFTVLGVGVVSRAGLISLCPLLFAAWGAWILAWLYYHATGIPLLADIVIAGLACLPLGALIGAPALRLRGVNLAIVTLSAATVTVPLLAKWDFPGVDDGLYVARTGWLASNVHFCWVCWALVLIVLALLAWIGRRQVGLGWAAIRESERAAASMGVSVPRAKLTAFAAGAFVAGIGGALMFVQIGTGESASFDTSPSILIFAVAVMFGARFAEGAIIAGIGSVLAPVITSDIGIPNDYGNMFFAFGAIQALRHGSGIAEAGREKSAQRRAKAGPMPPALARIHLPSRPAPAAPPIEPARLEVEKVTVRYGSVVALNQVSLSVEAGSVHGLIGPNGAGKSTLVDAIAGFVSVDEGAILLGGSPVHRMPPRLRAKAGLRRTFQQGRAITELTVRRYFELSAGRRMPEDEIARLAALVGPATNPDVAVGTFDVGTRRLLELAACLAARPRVLMLDEPAAGLGSEQTAQLARDIAAIPAEFGCSVLLIEHDIDAIKAACATVTVIDFGQVIADGACDEVLSNSDVIAAYLGSEAVTA